MSTNRDGASSEGGTPLSKRPTKNGEKSGEPPCVSQQTKIA